MPPPLEYWAHKSPAGSAPVSEAGDSDSVEELALLKQLAQSDEDDETWEPAKPKSSSTPQPKTSPSRQALPRSYSDHDAVFDEDNKFVGTLRDEADIPDTSARIVVEIPSSTLVVPKSLYQDFQPTAPESTEIEAVKSLIQNKKAEPNGDFELELDDFVVYTLSQGDQFKEYAEQMYPYELKPLQHLCVQDYKPALLYADGYLCNGADRYYVRKIPFSTVPIGNYGLESHTVGDQIWIQTTLYDKKASPAYFKLKKPAQEYVRYHTGFVWIVDLAKHVVDYLGYMETKQKKPVEFHHFESHFSKWLHRIHGRNEAFQRWFRQYGKEDFRIAVHANRRFIYKEAHGVMDYDGIHYHALWDEIIHFNTYKVMGSTRQDSDAATGAVPPTVVTPYIYDCFSELPFVSVLEAVEPSAETEALRQELIRKQHLEMPSKLHNEDDHTEIKTSGLSTLKRAIKVGSVISTMRDAGDEHWRRHANETHDSDRWFGLVQHVYTSKLGHRSFEVTWIYRPADTICGDMKYPWKNELFLSDHCSCGEVGMSKITEQEVTGVHRVHWGGSSTTQAEFFCRQTYLHQERRWITWQEDHLRCEHHTPKKQVPPYMPGDTVLVHIHTTTDTLEPCVVLTCDLNESQLLVLPRREKFRSDCAPNELVWSESAKPLVLKNSRIHGRCLVRYFEPHEQLTVPYDRSGVGNAFFIRTRIDPEQPDCCVPFTDEFPFPTSIRQGMNTDDHFPKLKGFDLFCGGGNFGRGLEDAGAIEMRWANDYDPRAVHTYMANLDGDHKAKVHPFVGSIDDLQRRAIEGKFSDNVPPVGEVEFVSGGSPCPGFSRLTLDKTTPKQRKNQSLVASFASFIDVYRPKYGILENVVEIVQGKNSRSEDVFSQLICAIVGLGYQAHFFLLDAWVYGSPQSRSRVFLAFAAPGFRLPDKPVQSHLEVDRKSKSLGWLPNGEPMVERLFLPAAFRPVTAEAALADLPYIGDGKHDACIPFPDHRQCYGVTKRVRTQFSLIPTRPYQTNFVKAYYNTGVITEAERQMAFPAAGMRVQRVSQAWGRVHPKKIMATVTTAAHPADTFMGKCLHWSQPRILSIMEVRRAQGFRDHEVILGETKEQWTTIGNSVAREVSVALGLSFREALLGSLVKSEETLHADASLIAEKMSVLATPGTTTPIQTPPMTESPAPMTALSDVLRREALFNSVRVPLDDDASDTTQPLRSSGPDGTEDGIDDFAAAKKYPPRYASSSRSSSDELTSNGFSVSTQATAVTRITSQETIQQGKKRQSSSISEAFEIHTTETTTIGEMGGVKRQRLEGI